MLWVAISAALVAAAMNAGSSILQRLATGKPEAKTLFSRHLVRRVTLSRLFLMGLGLQIAAFVMQALALANSSLTVVEPLLTTDLVFLLIFIYWQTQVKAGQREWLGVAAIMVGLSVMFLAAQPSGGQVEYSLLPWAIVTSVITFWVLGVIFTVRRLPSPNFRGALTGLAAGAVFALNAALTKLAINQLEVGGFGQMLSSWPVYALIISGLISLYVMQNAYGAGPLAITQPTLEISEPTISVVIGMTIFGDAVRTTPLAITGEIAGIVAVCYGVIALSTSPRMLKAGQRGI